MSHLTIEYTSQEAHKAILEANIRMEQGKCCLVIYWPSGTLKKRNSLFHLMMLL
ncbi:MAG: hypothetical protein GYB58_09990 [Gammaproteobacteria bacterium]|nr:hypothetical protein [Gammaproteobacteria bacterium]